MGVHQRQYAMDEMKKDYIKKSTNYLLIILALLGGVFIGNVITMVYVGQSRIEPSQKNIQQKQSVSSITPDMSAVSSLEKAANSDPTNAENWIKLGNYCFDHELPEKAVFAYERAVELKPMNVGVWSDLGVMYRRTKQFSQAVEAFGHAAALDKKHIVSRFNMGIVYLHDLNNRKKAIEIWKEVVAIDPNAQTPSGKSVSLLISELEK